MIIIKSLEKCIKDENILIGNEHKVWVYKNRTIVLDIKANMVNIALDIINKDDKIQLLIFGRDKLSDKLLENFLVPLNGWGNKKLILLDKLLLKEWSDNIDLDVVAKEIITLANIVKKQIEELKPRDLVFLLESFNDEVFHSIKQKVADGQNINIGFLVSERQKWNGQSLWDELTQMPGINCRVYLQIDRELNASDQLAFFEKIDSELVCLYDYSKKKNKSMNAYDVDLVFCQQPWTGLSTQVRRLIGRSLILYMHYGFLVYANSKMQYQKWDFHPFIWRYLSQSNLQRKIHLEYDPSMDGRQVVTGYPKLDVYLDPIGECDIWPEDNDKVRIIYAPHHSMRKNALKISTFSWNFNLLLELTHLYREHTQWVYKPHGRLKHSVVENDVMTDKEYATYIDKWDSQKNTTVYDEGNYFDLFRTSNVLITDCGSFLGEYFPTGNPIIWLVSDNANVELNPIGERLSRGFYKVNTRKELIEVFHDVVIKGNDPLKEYRQEVIREIFPLEEKSTTTIIKYITDTFKIHSKE